MRRRCQTATDGLQMRPADLAKVIRGDGTLNGPQHRPGMSYTKSKCKKEDVVVNTTSRRACLKRLASPPPPPASNHAIKCKNLTPIIPPRNITKFIFINLLVLLLAISSKQVAISGDEYAQTDNSDQHDSRESAMQQQQQQLQPQQQLIQPKLLQTNEEYNTQRPAIGNKPSHESSYRNSDKDQDRSHGAHDQPPLCNDCLAIPLIAIMGNGKQVNGFIIQQRNNEHQQHQQIEQQQQQASPMTALSHSRGPSSKYSYIDQQNHHQPNYQQRQQQEQQYTNSGYRDYIKEHQLAPKSDGRCPMTGPMTLCDQIDSYPADVILRKLEVAKKSSAYFNIDSLFSDESEGPSDPFEESRTTIMMMKAVSLPKPQSSPPSPRMIPPKNHHHHHHPQQQQLQYHHHHHHQQHHGQQQNRQPMNESRSTVFNHRAGSHHGYANIDKDYSTSGNHENQRQYHQAQSATTSTTTTTTKKSDGDENSGGQITAAQGGYNDGVQHGQLQQHHYQQHPHQHRRQRQQQQQQTTTSNAEAADLAANPGVNNSAEPPSPTAQKSRGLPAGVGGPRPLPPPPPPGDLGARSRRRTTLLAREAGRPRKLPSVLAKTNNDNDRVEQTEEGAEDEGHLVNDSPHRWQLDGSPNSNKSTHTHTDTTTITAATKTNNDMRDSLLQSKANDRQDDFLHLVERQAVSLAGNDGARGPAPESRQYHVTTTHYDEDAEDDDVGVVASNDYNNRHQQQQHHRHHHLGIAKGPLGEALAQKTASPDFDANGKSRKFFPQLVAASESMHRPTLARSPSSILSPSTSSTLQLATGRQPPITGTRQLQTNGHIKAKASTNKANEQQQQQQQGSPQHLDSYNITTTMSARSEANQASHFQASNDDAGGLLLSTNGATKLVSSQSSGAKSDGPPSTLRQSDTNTSRRQSGDKASEKQRLRRVRRQLTSVRADASGGDDGNGDADGSNNPNRGDDNISDTVSRGSEEIDPERTSSASGPIPQGDDADLLARPEPVCRAKSIYISPKAALNDKKQWKYVVNARERDPKIKQIIRVDICEDPFGPCSSQVSLPFGFTSQCKQKYAKKKLLALDARSGLLEVDTFFIPSCCVCQLIPDSRIPEAPLSPVTLEGADPAMIRNEPIMESNRGDGSRDSSS